MTGQVSFSEFVREINHESDNDDDVADEGRGRPEESEGDDEWKPGRSGAGSRITKRRSTVGWMNPGTPKLCVGFTLVFCVAG